MHGRGETAMTAASISAGDVPFPHITTFFDLRLYLYVSLFVVLAVTVPWICHMIHPLAGPALLPLFFFVLLAGILFGWRTGLLVGLLSPLISYGLSGMPLPHILPRIIAEATVYGFVAGLLRGPFSLGMIPSLAGAIVGGRLAAFILVTLTQGLSHSVHMAWETAKTGWAGIVLQFLFLPFVVVVFERLRSTYHHAD